MKRILSIIFLISIFFLPVGNLKGNNTYALAGCPDGVTFNVSQFIPVNFSAGINVYLRGNISQNITRVLVSWGDGKTDIITPEQINQDFKLVEAGYDFRQVGDFKPYVVLGTATSWNYICYTSTISVYYLYNWSGGTIRDPGSPNSITFNANTQFGGDNIIGAINILSGSTTGVGGDYFFDDAILTTSPWNIQGKLGGDGNTGDDNPNFTSGYPAYFILLPSSLQDRSNSITLSVTKPNKVWVNGDTVINPAPSAVVTISQANIYWRPRNVSQSPTPTPPSGGGCPPGYNLNPITLICELSPTEPPQATAWTFPSRVFDTYDNRLLPNITLKLYGTNSSTANVSDSIYLATCSRVDWDLERCRPTLNTSSYYKWYFVKKTVNPTGYSSNRAVCNKPNLPPSPTPGWDLCKVIDTNTLRWGGTWGFSSISKGFYEYSDFYVTQITPTPTSPAPTATVTVTPIPGAPTLTCVTYHAASNTTSIKFSGWTGSKQLQVYEKSGNNPSTWWFNAGGITSPITISRKDNLATGTRAFPVNVPIYARLGANATFPEGSAVCPAPTSPAPTGTVTPTRTPTPTPTTFIPPQAAWFQTQGGNLMAQNGSIRSSIPSSENFNTEITNTASSGILYFSGTINAGTDPGMKVNSTSFPELVSFSDLKNRFWSITTIAGDSNITPPDLTAGNGSLEYPEIYAKNANSTASGWNNFSGNAVIFINGNLTINQNVTVASGSFLGFVVSGNITLNPQVTNLQGFYLTDGNFSTGTQAPTLDNQLILAGTFVANQMFSLDRNLGNALNNSLPSEVFQYRPDFSFTAPEGLRKPYRFWGEETP